MSRFTGRAMLAATAAASLALVATPTAGAHSSQHHPKKWDRTLNEEVLAPFQISVDQKKVYIADGFTGVVSRIDHGELTPLITFPGEVAGLDVIDSGRTIAYTTTDGSGNTTLTVDRAGGTDVVADLSGYEQEHNPDRQVHYGLLDTAATECTTGQDWLVAATGGPATYTGLVDSHPYSVVSLGHGSWAVADAAGNDILAVSPGGHVSTMAVLPRQPLTLTADRLAALGAPPEASCLAGKTYAFEPVPTDVERGPGGRLFVSTLPGGPEDPSLGARGSVYEVNPWTGTSKRLATGFLGATNLAVTPDGTAYVTELFAGSISKVSRRGTVSTFRHLDGALAVEVAGNTLYVGTMAPMGENGPEGTGSVQTFRR